MNMKKIIANVILVILIFLLLGKYVPVLFGYHVYAIESGSMEPEYQIGSMIIVEECEFIDVEVNDVITFKQSGSHLTKTHRVIAIDNHLAQFTTKGDNNQEEDARKVSEKALVGKVVYSIGILGYVYLFIDTIPGMLCVILLAGVSVYLSTQTRKDKKFKE